MSLDALAELLDELIGELGQNPAVDALTTQRDLLTAPLRVAVAGRVKAGKSTLLNALVGERLAPTDAGECTKVVTWYRHGPTYRVTGVLPDESRSLTFDRSEGQLTIELGDEAPASFDRLEVSWPSDELANLTLIDTPGIDSVNRVYSQRSADLLTHETAARVASTRPAVRPDAVLYLMTHAHERDLALLDSFGDQSIAGVGLSNAIGVLSRCDEIAGGSRDTMQVADSVADRYRRDPRLADRCQTVLPLAGLLAETAVTLREDEFQKLQRIARIPGADLQLALLSVDRFVSTPIDGMPTTVERIHLLDRFGVYGVRLCCSLIASDEVRDSTALALQLQEHSGLTRLRASIESLFGHRARLLRQQAAMAAITRSVPHLSPGAQQRVAKFADHLAANDREGAEVKALHLLRVNHDLFDRQVAARAERILGSTGASPSARLGLADDTSSANVGDAARREHAYWAAIERRPGVRFTTRRVARLAQRSCESMIAASS